MPVGGRAKDMTKTQSARSARKKRLTVDVEVYRTAAARVNAAITVISRGPTRTTPLASSSNSLSRSGFIRSSRRISAPNYSALEAKDQARGNASTSTVTCTYSMHRMVETMWCGMLLTTWRLESPLRYAQLQEGA